MTCARLKLEPKVVSSLIRDYACKSQRHFYPRISCPRIAQTQPLELHTFMVVEVWAWGGHLDTQTVIA